jgi:hypothetical protein
MLEDGGHSFQVVFTFLSLLSHQNILLYKNGFIKKYTRNHNAFNFLVKNDVLQGVTAINLSY